MATGRTSRPKAGRALRRCVVLATVALAAAGAAFLLYRRGAASDTDPAQLPRPGAARGFNLLLVTLDTVRSDRLGCYGYKLAETPTIDDLAAHGAQFDNAVTPMPLTLPSHATMLTGLFPPHHGVRGNGNFRLAPQHVTLAETLKDSGYRTAAFVGCFVLDARFGLSQGFDTYDFEVAAEGFDPHNLDLNERPADAVTDSAVRWLHDHCRRGAAGPFFVWVHYFDPHLPYRAPYVKLPRFAGRPYDAEIAYVDSQLKRLLGELQRLDLRDTTLIALVSDHGEGLGEHDEPTHGLLLYDSTLRVAFILSNPRLFKQQIRIRDRLVSLADLRPTLEDLLGVSSPAEVDGISLLRGGGDPERAVYIETQVPFHAARCCPLYGLRSLENKYIRAPEPEYYDLRTDQRELNNLYRQHPAEAGAAEARLTEMLARWSAAGLEDGRRTISPEEARRLGALGYAHTILTTAPTGLPDPKAMLRADRKIGAALRMQRANRLDEALRLCQEALQECPASPDACELAAMLYQQLNRPEEAVAALRQCLELNPKCRTAVQLARVLLILKRYDEMDAALRTAESLDAGNGLIYVLRGDRLAIDGRLNEAIEQYELALRVDEHRVGMLVRPQIQKLRQAASGAP